MTTTEIRQLEAGALAFGQKTYGDDLADAMYLGTKSKQVQSFFITNADGQ